MHHAITFRMIEHKNITGSDNGQFTYKAKEGSCNVLNLFMTHSIESLIKTILLQ